jgi:hypothetical protein
MATIYKAPEHIKLPDLDFSAPYGEYAKKEEAYRDELRAWLKKNNFTEKEAGKCITIPMADSHAEYMVIKLKGGVELFHLELMDAWDSEFAELLTAEKVRDMIRRDENMAKLFGGSK